MNRRGFFATLLAPLAARFRPKPAGEVFFLMPKEVRWTPTKPQTLMMLEFTASGSGDYFRNIFVKARQLGPQVNPQLILHKKLFFQEGKVL